MGKRGGVKTHYVAKRPACARLLPAIAAVTKPPALDFANILAGRSRKSAGSIRSEPPSSQVRRKAVLYNAGGRRLLSAAIPSSGYAHSRPLAAHRQIFIKPALNHAELHIE